MTPEHQKYVPYALAGTIAVLCLYLVWQITHTGIVAGESLWIRRATARIVRQEESPADQPSSPSLAPGEKATLPGPGEEPKKLDPRFEIIVSRAMFGKPPEDKSDGAPPPVCSGILGDQAIVNDQLVRVGEKVGDYTVSKIRDDKVVLEKNGETLKIPVFPK